MRRISYFISSLIESMIRNISGGIGRKIRYSYYKRRLGGCGKNLIIDIGVIIHNPKDVYLRDNVWLDEYVIVLAGKPGESRKFLTKENPDYKFKLGELHIDSEVHIAPFVVLQAHGGMHIGAKSGVASGAKLYSLSHHYRNLLDKTDQSDYYFTPMVPANEQFLIAAPVVIGNAAAVGLNSVILPGTTVPDGTWLGVNTSLQGKSIQPNSIYAGEGAKLLKQKSS